MSRPTVIATVLAVAAIIAAFAFLPAPRHKLQLIEPAKEIPVRAPRDGVLRI
jgi:hypothetical protein